MAYQLSMQRLIEADSKMWQVPGLSLTAQAFLLTIALGSQSYTPVERVVAALLGAVVAIGSVQLMRRHKFHARCDLVYLRKLETRGVFPALVDREPLIADEQARTLATWRSTRVWIVTMWVFVVADVFAAVLALVFR